MLTTRPMPTVYQLSKSVWDRLPSPIRRCLASFPVLGWMKAKYVDSVRPFARHDELYTASYFDMVKRAAEQSAAVIARSIVTEFAPGSALDIGCGSGTLLLELRRLGVAVRGVEYSEAALALCRRDGLDVAKFDLESNGELDCPPADIVISTEVAEHLPESCAERYIDLLCSKSNAVVFTAATPGQGGMDHVNEQPHEYWLHKFSARGFRLEEELTLRWRKQWAAAGIAAFYHRNLMLLRREAS